MAPDRSPLSRGELDVARLLWGLKSATVREVHAALPDDRPLDFSTVQTYLRRLEAKGYVTSVLEGRTRVYRPRIRPKTVIRETVDDLVERLFGGEPLPLMRHLIEDRGLSDEEIAELRQLLNEREDS
ncbi:Penicillinase repressor [Maioricimonas rarisocia]|uniref:Penicillinase repressor n=1 Tax=Maioricimonas rarisocia TaxID=2528026 RepID=A0A517ZDQ7_9PLAN|nr:BlaI/MecI/CopY family transcriptional regulator [Maioricimonas rarisocia]QDU40605.1 Penicillinase repressor [Maioricimonas rarisocia]